MDELSLIQECRTNAKWEYNENGDTAIHTSLCKAADAIERLSARVAELERNLQNIMDDDLKAQTLVEQEMEIGRLESQLDTLRKQEPVMIVKRGVNAFTFFDSTGLQGCDELPDGTPLYTLNPSTTHSASLKEKK